MEEVVDSLKQQLELSFHFLLFQSYYWTSVCEIFDPSNIQYFTFEMKHLYVSTYVCTHMAGPWLFSRTRVLLPFSSTMPTFTVNLVSLEWRVRVPFHPRCIRTFRERNEMDLPFRFDFFQKSCFPFQSKLTCKRKDRKFMHFSFFYIA